MAELPRGRLIFDASSATQSGIYLVSTKNTEYNQCNATVLLSSATLLPIYVRVYPEMLLIASINQGNYLLFDSTGLIAFLCFGIKLVPCFVEQAELEEPIAGRQCAGAKTAEGT